jgi:hypothetical protein
VKWLKKASGFQQGNKKHEERSKWRSLILEAQPEEDIETILFELHGHLLLLRVVLHLPSILGTHVG